MSTISLVTSKSAIWVGKKKNPIKAVGAVVSSEAEQEHAETAVIGVSEQKKKELFIWSPKDGFKPIKKSNDKNIIGCVTEDCATGVFFSTKKRPLGFYLIEHSRSDIYSIKKSKICDHSSDLEGPLKTIPSDPGESAYTFFSIRKSQLKKTARGFIVAAVISTPPGNLYFVVGLLDERKWKVWSLDGYLSSQPCIYIGSEGKEVKLVRCDITHPIDKAVAILAPTIHAGLSVFDRVFPEHDASESDRTANNGQVSCVVFREKNFRLDDSSSIVERVFQSQCFVLPEQRYTHPYQCYVDALKSKPVFSIVVPCQGFCTLLHLTYSECGDEVFASPTALGSVAEVLVLCTQEVKCATRETGTLVTFFLSGDFKLFACEVLGTLMDVKVNGKENDLASLFADEDYKQSVSLTRLLALAPGQLLYSTGMQCAILDISSALFTTPLPERITLSPKESVKSVDDKDRAGLMESCLDILNEGVTSEGGTTVERCTSLFQKILPLIRYLGTSQQELFLIQTFLGRFFHIASPTCEEDWSVLWSLSLIVQKILAKRSRDNSSVFTDEFFLHLYNEFKSSGYKTTETEKMVRDGAEERVSSEMKKMVHQSKWDSTLSPETRFVLEGLYSGEPIVPFAYEVVRRMVETNTLSNGACVIRPKSGLGPCVHAVGVSLLASCLDISIFLATDDAGSIFWSLDKQKSNSSSVPIHPFESKDEFCVALSLATDIISIPSGDPSFRPDVAVYLFGLSRRSHCLKAFISLFTSTVSAALKGLEPLSTNRSLIEDIASSLGISYDDTLTKALGNDANIPLSISYVVCNSGSSLDGDLFKFVSYVLPQQFSTSIATGFLFYTSGRLLAAQDNYAAAVSKLVLCPIPDGDAAARSSVETCRERLESVKLDARVLWAQINELTPFKLLDVIKSYLSSVRVSMEEASYTDASRGTTVSRCVIACFRIFLVVEFVGIWENKLDEITAAAERETEEPASTSHPAINGILQALQGLIMLNVSALPTEWLHLKFLHLVSRVASSLCRKPEWNQFLIRLLEVSSIQETSISSHKKKYFELVDQIRARQVSRDRDDRTYFLAQECCSRIQSIEAALGSFQFVSGTPFVFSRTQDKGVPAWDETDHGRDYLIKADWKDHLTTVEFHSDLLKEVASVVVKAALKFDPGEQPETRPDNPILARPLYEHISQTNPPIRTYAAVEPAVKAPPTLNKDVAPRSIPSLRPGLMASTGGTVFDSQPPPVAIQRHTSTTSSTTLDDDDDAPPLRPEVVVGGKPPVKKELPDDPLLLKWSAPQSRSEPFSASAIAWWENGPKTADISPGKDTDDLSDSATSFTTTTSKSGSQYSAELLRSNSDRQREKQGHKGHCKCRKRLYAEPSGDNKRSSSSHKNEIPRVRMLEFTRVLRPPMSPHTKRSTSGESEPVMIRANYPQKENKTERESIPFLCLPTKPATHQSVYRIADFSQRGSEPANPSFQCASSKVGVRYLGEPKLPSSSVFCAPPPLLHLSKGHSSTPAVFSSPETRTHEHEYQLRNPANYTVGQQILREPCGAAPEPTRMGEVSSAQRDLDGSYPHAPIVSGTSHVSHPILSPDEKIQFREYTDNLMAGGAGGESFNPSLQPTLPSQAPVPAPCLAQQEYESGKTGEEDGSGYANLLTQHNDFLNKAHDLMNQREKENDAFYNRVSDTVRTLTEATLALRGGAGLAPSDQSELLRNSIKQKNELLNLNRDFLDLQINAARAGVPNYFNRESSVVQSSGAQETHTEKEIRDFGLDPIAPSEGNNPRSAQAIETTLDDLRKLNNHLQGMNVSAEAMEKAIRETREAIKKYEAQESLDALNAEGAAMLSSLKYRTDAAERRLAEIPRSTTALAASSPSAPARRSWSIAPTAGDGLQVGAGGERRTSTFISSSSLPLSEVREGERQATSPNEGVNVGSASVNSGSRQFASSETHSVNPREDGVVRMDEVSIHPPEAASKRSSVVSYPESPRSLRSPRQINFVNEGKDVWDTREKPVVFTARKESLKDVFDGSRRRVSEFNPPKSIMSPSAGRRRSTRVSLSAKPAEPVPKRFSMYMPSSPSRRRSTSRNNVAAVSSLDDLYQESMPPPLSSSLLLSETAPAASTRRMEGINRRISLLEEEFK